MKQAAVVELFLVQPATRDELGQKPRHRAGEAAEPVGVVERAAQSDQIVYAELTNEIGSQNSGGMFAGEGVLKIFQECMAAQVLFQLLKFGVTPGALGQAFPDHVRGHFPARAAHEKRYKKGFVLEGLGQIQREFHVIESGRALPGCEFGRRPELKSLASSLDTRQMR